VHMNFYAASVVTVRAPARIGLARAGTKHNNNGVNPSKECG